MNDFEDKIKEQGEKWFWRRTRRKFRRWLRKKVPGWLKKIFNMKDN